MKVSINFSCQVINLPVEIYIVGAHPVGNCPSYGQLAVIADSRRYIDLKEDTFDNAKVTGRIFHDDIFLLGIGPDYYPTTWSYINYDPDMNTLERGKRSYYERTARSQRIKGRKIELQGFIQDKYVMPINSFEKMNRCMTSKGRVLFWNDSIRIEIAISPFDSLKHKMELDEYHNARKIDSRNVAWTIGQIPFTELSEIMVAIHGKEVKVPKNQYNDLFDCEILDIDVFLDRRGNIYIFKADRSDGGGYAVAWLIKNGKYLKRYIDGNG